MIEKVEEMAMVQFLSKFDEQPFLIKFRDNKYQIGKGEPVFTVHFKKVIPVSELLNSTSIALGEAYMNGDLDIEGNLYDALDHFLGQMGKFSTDETALKKLIHSPVSKKNQEKEVTSHVESIALLQKSNRKPDTYVKLNLDMEDYYRIKDQEK